MSDFDRGSNSKAAPLIWSAEIEYGTLGPEEMLRLSGQCGLQEKEIRVEERVVFDVGLHNGDDSAYYLHLGYRVVGVEANPLLAAQAVRRFAREIEQGRMAVLNVGILEAPGEFTFYRNLTNDGLSSFLAERGKKGGRWEEARVHCITTAQLIADYGQPYFMKVDIEGADLQALKSLTPATAPKYVSLELSVFDPIVERLIELGYSAFKFVDGETYYPTTPIFEHEIGWRLLRRVGHISPFVHKTIARLPVWLHPKSDWNPPGKYSPDQYPFGWESSGAFGELAGGSWMTPKKALRWIAALRKSCRRASKPPLLWLDVHARHCSAP